MNDIIDNVKRKIKIHPEELKNIEDLHSNFNEKIILDIVNGISVVARDLNNKNKSLKGFSALNDKIRGNKKQRDELINDLFINAIEGVSLWLREHEKSLTAINYKIFKLSEELIKTQNEIIQFFNDYKNLKHSFIQFQKNIENKLQKLEDRILESEIKNDIDIEIEKLNNTGFGTEVELFIILDNLMSGRFGKWLIITQSKEKQRLLNYFFDKIKGKINNKMNQLLDTEKFYKQLNNLPNYEKKAINYIASVYRQLNPKPYYDTIDLFLIASKNNSEENFIKEINKNSHIRTFMSYNDFIEDLFEFFAKTYGGNIR